MAIFTRAKTITASNVSSITAEFDEDSLLDSSYTLFAVLYVTGTSATVTSNSWGASALPGSGNNGSINYLGGYTVLANGSRNSFTAEFSSSVTSAKIDLYAFQGADTPIVDGTGYGVSSSGSVTTISYGPATATTYANVISITAVSLIGGKGEWGTFSDGYIALPAATGNMISAVKAFTTTGQSPTPTMTWTSARTARASIWNIQGVSAEVSVPFENIITMNLGPIRPLSLNVGSDYVDRMYLGADLLQIEEDTTPPSVPSLSNPVVSGRDVALTCTISTDNSDDVTYEFYRDGEPIGSTRSTSYTDVGLTPGETYSYAVSAYDQAGNYSAKSSIKTATIAAAADTIAPSVPVLDNPTVDGTTVELSWSASTDNVGVTGYKVYRSTTLIATVTGLTFADNGRTAGSTYSYKVAASDAAGNTSAQSAAKSITIPMTPPPATNVIYGPSGSFWPRDTADIRTAGSYTIFPASACSWKAIKTRLDALSPAQIDAGAVITIPPGALPDDRTTPSDGLSAQWLKDFANTRTKRILIIARDGWGSVTAPNGVLYTNITGLVFMGIKYSTCAIAGGTNFGIAWSSMEANSFTFNASSTGKVTNCTVDEICVGRETILKNSDTAQMQGGGGNTINGVVIRGSYYGPTWIIDGKYDHSTAPLDPIKYPDGKFPHTDTLQFSLAIGSDITFQNTAVFASHNAGILGNSLARMKLDKCMIVGGSLVNVPGRHPFLQGGAGYPGAIEGPGGRPALLGAYVDPEAKDSYIFGSPKSKYKSVINTRVSIAPLNAPASGSFTVDPNLSNWTNADFIAAGCPKPTTASLTQAWEYPTVVA
jgi:chitodextrinase